ncbi:peptidase inhibitor family I36 protein [Devosia sp.]|uniref:peptidase inhibitor family I36 protein n=1 Tax=Devosia sp. TaxID=1871048 RepID=UPI00326670C8
MLKSIRAIATVLPSLGLAALAIGALAGMTAPAMAGTHAWSSAELILLQGPGEGYDQTGSIAADEPILVDRCQRLWCQVHAGHEKGWTHLGLIRFGLESRPGLTGPRLNYASGGSGQVCLFEGAHYTGSSVCLAGGVVYNDLLLGHADNLYSSIQVPPGASVTLCRDRFFKSYCARINEDQPVLQQYLNNAVSSIHVW